MASILSIIPYNFYPPKSGGAIRCYYLLRAISKNHKVYVLSIQPLTDFYKDDEYLLPNNITIISIPDGNPYRSLFNILPNKFAVALAYRWLKRSIVGPANNILLQAYPSLVSLLRKKKIDLILYENLESLALFRTIISRYTKSAKHVYDAHNIDSKLWEQQYNLKKTTKYLNYAQSAMEIEKKLYCKADYFLCCSENDKNHLSKLNNNKILGTVVPNGVDISLKPFDKNPSKRLIENILFCGSLDYLPNKEGILWFYNKVFPKIKKELPNLKLTVIGVITDYSDYSKLIDDEDVNFVGEVPDVTLFYSQSSVSIVPLISGSGTRLKILEAMSMGSLVVSTTIGAEGIDYVPDKHILIADQPEEFAYKISSILKCSYKYDSIRFQAFDFVKINYDWKNIEAIIDNVFNNFLIKKDK